MFGDGGGHEDGGGVGQQLEADATERPDVPLLHNFLTDLRLSFAHLGEQFGREVGPTVAVCLQFEGQVKGGKVKVVFIIDDHFPGIQTCIDLPFLMNAVDQYFDLLQYGLSLLLADAGLVEIVLQGLEPGLVDLNLCLDDVVVKFLALLQDEHVVCQNDPVFMKPMQSFETRQLFLVVLPLDEAHLL